MCKKGVTFFQSLCLCPFFNIKFHTQETKLQSWKKNKEMKKFRGKEKV